MATNLKTSKITNSEYDILISKNLDLKTIKKNQL